MPLSGLQHPASCRGKSSLCLLRACHVPGTMPSTLCGSPYLVFTITPSDENVYVFCIRTKLSTENWVAFSTSIPVKRNCGIVLREISLGLCPSYLFWTFFFFAVCLFVFWPCHMACKILVPWPGIEPGPSTVSVWSPIHWTTREFPAPHTSSRNYCVF